MRRIVVALVLALGLAAPSPAETDSPGDPFARFLFPPERVIGHAQEIGLDEAQKTAVRNEVQKAQSKFLDLQFAVQEEMGKVGRLLQENPVDETKVLSQIDRVLGLEREVKRLHISLLIRIRNLLTPAQQAKLAEIEKGGR
jgi:Spy/CpxP family protein refolding chaperone